MKKHGITQYTCHPHIYPQVEWATPAFTSQPQSFTTLWSVLISHPAEGRRLSCWVNLGGWWHTETVYPRNETVNRLSTNRARRRITSLIRLTMLSLRHTAIMCRKDSNSWNNLQGHQRSEVIGNGTILYITRFPKLLVFHCNCISILYRFVSCLLPL